MVYYIIIDTLFKILSQLAFHTANEYDISEKCYLVLLNVSYDALTSLSMRRRPTDKIYE